MFYKKTQVIVYMLLSSLFSVVMPKQGRSQDSTNAIGHVSISSPTAASLGKYGDIPVSYHTGIPQVSIPLYTVKAGPLSLPVSLSYHASGIKVMEPASWVGIGWSLNAGGVITRTVMGQPDERGTNVGGVENDGHFSDYGYNNYLFLNGQEDWLSFADNRKDGEPDLFFFNFGGYTGKFYFRDDRTPVLVPQQDLKIVPYYPADSTGYISTAAGAGSIQAFTVTTPDGTQYFFGNSPGLSGNAPIEVTDPYTSQNGQGGNCISSWYLNKISSADGQFNINLSYVAENYGYFTIAMFPIDGPNTNAYSPYEYNVVKNLVSGVRLNQVSFPNGSISLQAGSVRSDLSDNSAGVSTDFVNQSAATLGALQITDSINNFCKKYHFYYGYFIDSTGPLPGYLGIGGYSLFTDRKRLRLDSIQETSCDSTLSVPPYKFSYYTEQVPRRMSFGQDHWGFANGVANNSTLIPTYILNGATVPGANRDAAWPAMRGGALNQITYPTGGFTQMNFEANSVYTSYNQADTPLDKSSSIGYDGGTSSQTVSFTLTAAPEIAQYWNTCGWDATAVVRNSGNSVVETYSIPANTNTQHATFSLPAGTYSVTLSFNTTPNNLSGGTGPEISFSHAAIETISGNTLVGGLRINSTVTNDGLSTGNNIVTNYSYVNGSSQSTGVLYSIPTYVQEIRNDLIENLGYFDGATNGFEPYSLNPSGCPDLGDYYKSGGSIRPMSTVQGNHIGYSQIKVSQPGNGYSLYTYYVTESGFTPTLTDVCVRSANTTACDPTAPNYPAAPPPLDYKRGELYYEQHYSNSGQLLKDIYYYPSFDTTAVLPTPAFIVNRQISVPHLLGTEYQLWTVRKTQMMTVEDDYDMQGGGAITKAKTVYYGSPFHNQPTRSVETTATGDSLISNTKYVFDLRLSTCDALGGCTGTYTTACASCQSQYNTARSACDTSSSCLTSAYENFHACLAGARSSFDSCQRVNYINPVNAFGTCHTSTEHSADTLLQPVLRLQDEFINAPIEVSNWRDQSLLHASYIGYDSSITPSGFAYPGRTQLVNLAAPSSTFSSAAVSGSTIGRDSRYLDESVYSYYNGNPQQVIPRSGVPNAFIWDYRNTAPIAKATGATVDQIAYSSFEADGTGSWIISSALRDTGSITGNACYNLQHGSISRSGLTSANRYVVSYWSKAGSYFVSGSTSVLQGKTIGGWTYYEHSVGGVSSVLISGGGDIDELRLYPQTAQLTTYTYSPLVGITSQCDIGNRVTYYNYDALGRLMVVKDQDGNIIKTIQYHYAGQAQQQTY